MNILTLDFETFFSDDYTLKKMTTEAYVRDLRFEALMVGLRACKGNQPWIAEGESVWYGADALQDDILGTIDWSNTAVLCHHAHFDLLILSHHYGIKPRFIYDTLSMARLQLGNHVSVGLESLARHYGLAGKSVPYERFRGKRWGDVENDLRVELASGCLHDLELTWDIFQRLAVGFPAEEYQVIDMTVRMFTEPQLLGDVDTLAKVWTDERDRKAALLREFQIDVGALQSAEQFGNLLRAEGIEPETKPGKNAPIGAFAKTDQFMIDLLEHEDEYVRALAEARLGLKSTAEQTRAERLGFMAMRGKI
jgi:DNA polymerase